MFLISDEGRALATDLGFGEILMEVLMAPAKTGAYEPYVLRFYAPETAKNNEKTYETTVWSFGCLLYEVFYPSTN
jgi:hypothetical protein